MEVVYDTTVNISEEAALQIDDAAEQLGISVAKLVNKLAKLGLSKEKGYIKYRKRKVEYQESEENTVWKCVHAHFDPKVYENLVHVRCFGKFSVSMFIYMIIKKYLSIFIDIVDEKPYSYLNLSYSIDYSLENSDIIWVIRWKQE